MTNSFSVQAKKRIWYLDILRIVSAYGIVVLHFSPLPESYSAVDTLPFQVFAAISVLFRWCVPAFFMISGALFLGSRHSFSVTQLYRKTILRIAASFFVWSSFYAVVHCILNNKGKWTFLNQLFRGHYHMWYIFAILALYMLTPLLRRMTESRKLTEYFLGLGFLFTFLLPRVVSFVLLFDIPSKDVVQSLQSALAQVNPLSSAHALYYYVLGHYLHAYAADRKMMRLAVPAAVMGGAATIILTMWHSGMIGEPSGRFYDPSSLTVLFFSAGMFLIFRHAFDGYTPSRRLEPILRECSACSFGIYLLHPFIIERLALSPSLNLFVLILERLGIAFCIFAVAFALTNILRRIPIVGRYIV